MANLISDAYETGDFTKLIYEFAPVGLVVTENRVIRDCNPTFAHMFRYDPSELRDRSFAPLYPTQEEFVNIRDRGDKDLRKNNSYWDERVMMRKTGELFWCRVRGHSFTREDPIRRAVWSFADLSDTRPYYPLTRREREVFSLIGEGKTSKEIAISLGISHRTVEVHRSRLLKKFRASNTAGLFQSLVSIGGERVASSGGH
ncbi:Tetrathionate response regulatory protein TtrR [Thalassovita gelatinovora]|uniref:Tetrathionate response regulatory protein TtrR n=1 Tax=Thalassovita gelatinovora TaxID=53501 RepID=A0A0P1FBP3_THAGE|nr:LuxR C-terminal-related transcriptional regulator [Thalassovita gelatinovora]QIZ79991.1 PAS domain-containing protein [Thalassovita gelatinovora]CUH65651.1 Tetrathionate response regulatory protein TtrR [Thalassovita gelatinovora]SER05592.1 PAS domain S-box-containing protein [Thalassovita gelatinovora]